MAENGLMRNLGGTGLTLQRVAVIGVAGGLTVGVSGYWVDKWFTEDTDAKSQERKRALTQAALGVGAAYVVKRWSRDAAIGCAAGGIVGAVMRLWDSEDMDATMRDWFDSEDTPGSSTPPANPPTRTPGAGAVYGEQVVFSSPRTPRANVRM